jgi:hypothetical protein
MGAADEAVASATCRPNVGSHTAYTTGILHKTYVKRSGNEEAPVMDGFNGTEAVRVCGQYKCPDS